MVAAAGTELGHIIERRGERKGSSRKPDALIHRNGSVQTHIVIAHIGVRTVALLIGVIVFAIAGQCSREVHLRKQFRPETAVTPIGRFQLPQCRGGIHTLLAGQHNSFGQSQCTGRQFLSRKQRNRQQEQNGQKQAEQPARIDRHSCSGRNGGIFQ